LGLLIHKQDKKRKKSKKNKKKKKKEKKRTALSFFALVFGACLFFYFSTKKLKAIPAYKKGREH